jgi:hypothetical protein
MPRGNAEETHLRAMLAETAYQRPTMRAGWMKKNALDRYGYIYDADNSDEHTAVFYNPQTKKVITSFRGTQLHHGTKTAVEDLSTDAMIVLGLENFSTRFKDTKTKHDQVLKTYGDGWEHEVVGHSLGGSLANYVGRANKTESHAFNPGSVKSAGVGMSDRIRRTIDPKYKDEMDKHNVYITGYDPLSVSEAWGAGVHYYKVKEDNERNRYAITPSHSVDAFTLLQEK